MRLPGSAGGEPWYVGLAGRADRESSLWRGNRHRTQKEAGTGTRRQGRPKEGWEEAEEMGSSSSVWRSSRYTSVEHAAVRHLEGSPKVPNSGAPSQGLWGDGEDLKTAPVTPQPVSTDRLQDMYFTKCHRVSHFFSQ